MLQTDPTGERLYACEAGAWVKQGSQGAAVNTGKWIAKADHMTMDGTVCTLPDDVTITIGAGPETKTHRTFQCISQDTDGVFEMSLGPIDVKIGTPLQIKMVSFSVNATPSGSSDYDAWAVCESANNGATDDAYGSAVVLTTVYTDQNQWETSNGGGAAVVTPSGCNGNDQVLTVQLKMLTGAGQSDTQMDDVHIYSVEIEWTKP